MGPDRDGWKGAGCPGHFHPGRTFSSTRTFTDAMGGSDNAESDYLLAKSNDNVTGLVFMDLPRLLCTTLAPPFGAQGTKNLDVS